MRNRLMGLILLWMACSTAGVWAGGVAPCITSVFLYNISKKEVKTECRRVMGKHDAFPIYQCVDNRTEEYVPFDPGKEWVSLEAVCFRHNIRGTIKTRCACYQLEGKKKPKYLCLDEKSKQYTSFDPANEWKLLQGDDSQFAPKEIEIEVIKHFDFELNAATSEQSEDNEEKEAVPLKDEKKK